MSEAQKYIGPEHRRDPIARRRFGSSGGLSHSAGAVGCSEGRSRLDHAHLFMDAETRCCRDKMGRGSSHCPLAHRTTSGYSRIASPEAGLMEVEADLSSTPKLPEKHAQG